MNIQQNSQKLAGTSTSEDTTRTKWLREEIAKKQAEIQSAQRQYKELIEHKFEEGGKQVSSGNVHKLEEEMKQIKQMLKDYGME